MKHWLAALVAGLLAGCGDNGLVAHPPPVVIAMPLKLGEEVVCIETRVRIGLPNAFPILSWAKREWTCDLRAKRPVG